MSGLRTNSVGDYVEYEGTVIRVTRSHVCIARPIVCDDYSGWRGSGLHHTWVPKPYNGPVYEGCVVGGTATLSRYGPRGKPSFAQGDSYVRGW